MNTLQSELAAERRARIQAERAEWSARMRAESARMRAESAEWRAKSAEAEAEMMMDIVIGISIIVTIILVLV